MRMDRGGLVAVKIHCSRASVEYTSLSSENRFGSVGGLRYNREGCGTLQPQPASRPACCSIPSSPAETGARTPMDHPQPHARHSGRSRRFRLGQRAVAVGGPVLQGDSSILILAMCERRFDGVVPLRERERGDRRGFDILCVNFAARSLLRETIRAHRRPRRADVTRLEFGRRKADDERSSMAVDGHNDGPRAASPVRGDSGRSHTRHSPGL
jgi:hypothetical protein